MVCRLRFEVFTNLFQNICCHLIFRSAFSFILSFSKCNFCSPFCFHCFAYNIYFAFAHLKFCLQAPTDITASQNGSEMIVDHEQVKFLWSCLRYKKV